ncbi:hypothetical protein BGW39_002401 [Mortierella sp. 14UC]|nr:hypothetical protein BGW39_002401 [Mortierella sp. 14UC]
MARKQCTLDLAPFPSFTLDSNHNNKSPVYLVPSILCYTTEGFFDNNSTSELDNSLQQQPFFHSAAAVPHNSGINDDQDYNMDALDEQFMAMELNNASANWSQDPYQIQLQPLQPQSSIQGASPAVAVNNFAVVASTTNTTSVYTGTAMDPGFGNGFPAHPGYDYYDSGYGYFSNYPPADSIYPADTTVAPANYHASSSN